MWRYAELLPLDGPPTVGTQVGDDAAGARRPPGQAPRRSRSSGSRTTPSATRRCRSRTAWSRWRSRRRVEFGFDTVACASTGNLANAVAAHAAAAGLPGRHPHPRTTSSRPRSSAPASTARASSASKGTYDDVNRLCSEIAGKYGWGFVNVNLRPFYAEGSKTYAYEIAEQLGWRTPDHVVVPMAGGSLVTKIGKAFGELDKLGLSWRRARKRPRSTAPRRPAARRSSTRCSPGASSSCAGEEAEEHRASRWPSATRPTASTRAQTIIGSGGWARRCPSDEEIVAGMRLLAETEGIFTETAGGVTVAARAAPDRRAAQIRRRRVGGPLHHRPGAEDAGPAGRRAARAAGSSRPQLSELRRSSSDLDTKETRPMATIRIPTPLRKLTARQGRGHRDRRDGRRASSPTSRTPVPGHQGAHLRRQRRGAQLRQHLRQRRGHPLPQEPRHAGQGQRRDLDRPGDRGRLTTSRRRWTLPPQLAARRQIALPELGPEVRSASAACRESA